MSANPDLSTPNSAETDGNQENVAETLNEQTAQTDEEDLKNYLGETLVPLLSYALDELEKVRPPDPVLFLAHFLLRHNPKKSYQ